MSRGFVKEDDQEEVPMVPPRADLPDGVSNYVTQAGMDELLAEKQMMLKEREQLDSTNENERRIAVNHLNAKMRLLDNRIDTARIVDLKEEAPEKIKFGAFIKLKEEANNKVQSIQIVGVDEADFSKGKISFTSPLSKVLINKKVGDQAVLNRGQDKLIFEILDIDYK